MNVLVKASLKTLNDLPKKRVLEEDELIQREPFLQKICVTRTVCVARSNDWMERAMFSFCALWINKNGCSNI